MSSVCGAVPTTHPIPSCSTYQGLYNLSSWAEFALAVPTEGHGSLHVNVGGAFGCSDAFESLLDAGYDSALIGKMRLEIYHVLASLYRSVGFAGNAYIPVANTHTCTRTAGRSGLCAVDGASDLLECPAFCSLDVPANDCMCTCRDAHAPIFNYSNLVGCMAANEETQAKIRDLTDEAQEHLVRTMCTSGGVMGENEESASPADPIFWV